MRTAPPTFLLQLYALISALLLCETAPAEVLQPGKLFIAGDSTAASYQNADHQGWGAPLQDYFNSRQLLVDNRARGGRSSRTFITEGHWGKLVDEIQPGDMVLIQFGHNDAGAINDDSRARGTLPGIGEESREIHNLLTGKDETVYTFGHYIRQMVRDVRTRQGVPVLLSLTVRNKWESSRIERINGGYSLWMYQIAWEMNTPFIDVSNLVADELEALGPVKVAGLYPKDHTHYNDAGADLHARIIVSALKGLRPALTESRYAVKGRDVIAYDWTFLRLPLIADAKLPSIFLVGDSTVRNGRGDGTDGQWGWGDFLHENIDTHKFNIVNRAVGGFSSRTFVTGPHWQKALNMMRPGDYLILQFGHNDAAALNDATRARGTIRGIGEETESIQNLLTGKAETVHSYGWYLRSMIGEALARGITPILCSPVPRKKWQQDSDTIAQPGDSYPQWAQTVAEQAGIGFIDLNTLVSREYNELGRERVENFFADEHTHTSLEGARFTARLAAREILRVIDGGGPPGSFRLPESTRIPHEISQFPSASAYTRKSR